MLCRGNKNKVNTLQVGHTAMPHSNMPLLCVKNELDWDDVSEAAARDGLYAGHQVKQELVLGPEVLQPADIAFVLRADAVGAPPEPCLETPHSHRSIGDTELYAEHELKQELTYGAGDPPMVRIPSLYDFDDLYTNTNYVKGMPPVATEPNKALTQPQTVKTQEKHRKLYNIRPCTIPLVRIDETHKETNGKRIVENKRSCSDKKKLKPKIFFCDFCSKGFAMKQSLQVHIRIHTGEKPFSCPVCRKKFSDLSILIRHRRIHTGEKPHTCDVCPKQFSEKYLLRYHKRLHTGGYPYACQYCTKTYNHISNLKRHIRHHENKPFICEICDLHYKEQSKLDTHLLTHLKNKPYACDTCGKCFALKGHLNRHSMIHGVNKFCCKVCGHTFSQLGALKKHVDRRICGKR